MSKYLDVSFARFLSGVGRVHGSFVVVAVAVAVRVCSLLEFVELMLVCSILVVAGVVVDVVVVVTACNGSLIRLLFIFVTIEVGVANNES